MEQPGTQMVGSDARASAGLNPQTLRRLDALVHQAGFPSRSQAVEAAIEEKLARLDRAGLARECAKLDAGLEKALAEEGLGADVASWPDY